MTGVLPQSRRKGGNIRFLRHEAIVSFVILAFLADKSLDGFYGPSTPVERAQRRTLQVGVTKPWGKVGRSASTLVSTGSHSLIRTNSSQTVPFKRLTHPGVLGRHPWGRRCLA